MEKMLDRYVRPGKGLYIAILFVFCALAFITGHYLLGTGEAVVSILTAAYYLVDRQHRRRMLQQYIQSEPETLEGTTKGDGPLPALMVRLEDGSIVWENYRFSEISGGLKNAVDEKLDTVLPGLALDFLATGKNEAPQDVTLAGRRYRVYGTVLRSSDSRLGVLYFTDLTELYQVRDEYIRSRPVISIILIDNPEPDGERHFQAEFQPERCHNPVDGKLPGAAAPAGAKPVPVYF